MLESSNAIDSSTPAAETDASPEHAFSEAEFREHLLNYLCVLSCKFIGDDVAYIRYMQKQCAPCPCLQPVRLSCCHKMN